MTPEARADKSDTPSEQVKDKVLQPDIALLLRGIDVRLVDVVNAWATLPDALKAAVIAIVKSVKAEQ